MLILPPECRGLFKEPFGSLYPDFSDISKELTARTFCCVGDVVTQNAFRFGLTPAVSVIDGVTKRSHVVTLPKFSGRTFTVSNPAGTITGELCDVAPGPTAVLGFSCSRSPAGPERDRLTRDASIARWPGVRGPSGLLPFRPHAY